MAANDDRDAGDAIEGLRGWAARVPPSLSSDHHPRTSVIVSNTYVGFCLTDNVVVKLLMVL